jgi:hypothetical protein
LSNPTARAISAAPDSIAWAAVNSALAPVPQPLYTPMNGTPVSPSSLTSAAAWPLSRLPPAANPTWSHVMPASARARRAAIRPISRPEISNRPKG